MPTPHQYKCPHCHKWISNLKDQTSTSGRCPLCDEIIKLPFPSADTTSGGKATTNPPDYPLG